MDRRGNWIEDFVEDDPFDTAPSRDHTHIKVLDDSDAELEAAKELAAALAEEHGFKGEVKAGTFRSGGVWAVVGVEKAAPPVGSSASALLAARRAKK